MSERCAIQSPAPLDRPLQRLAWVVPVSLCLWILVLVAFTILLGKIAQPPPVASLELSLTDLPYGMPGGSPGGGPGPRGGGGPVASKPMDRPLLPATHSASAFSRSAPSVALPARRKPALQAAKKKKVEVEATNPAPRADEEPEEETEPARAAPAATGAPIAPAGATHATISSLGGGIGGVGPAGAETGSGGGGTGNRIGGSGAGTGGGFGEGSQPYATVEHPPVPVSRVLPEYPRAARARGLQGEVILRAIVDRQGAVEREVEVVESVPLLDDAAIQALRRWRFEPGRDASNRPVRVVIQVPLRFRLR